MLETLRNSLAKWIAPTSAEPVRRGSRMYAGAKVDRLTEGWVAGSTSADSEIFASLRTLRNRARALERDNDYAKQVVRLFKNNVVGQGIRMQAQVKMRRGGKMDDETNDKLECAFERWCRKETCSTSGRYSFTEIQQLVAAAQPTSGEIMIHKVRRAFGGGRTPFALEVIEADQVVDNYNVGRTTNGNTIKMGVEMDEWSRPVAYWMYPRHPGDYQFAGGPSPTNRYIRVPADEIIHLFIKNDRPVMTRGVPGFHTALRRLNNMGGYEEAEIVAARASACIMGFITSADEEALAPDGVENGERVTDMSAGEIRELSPGETFTGFTPNRPNTGLEPFMRFMLRGMAAGVGVSYESVSRDYSQSNYSSSRLALQDDRDNWRVLQDWIITDLCQHVYEEWLDAAVLAGDVPLPTYESNPEPYRDVHWMPRGWAYIDPLKEAMADKLRIRSGLTTLSAVIAGEGGDYEDVLRQRKREVDLAKELNLILETDPGLVNDKGQVQPDPAAAAAMSGAAGDGTGAEGDGQAKALPLLYATLERAIATDRDDLAAMVLDRIYEIEKQQAAA